MTPPAPIAGPPTTWWPTSLAFPLIPRIRPRLICGRNPSRSLNSWQGSHSSATCNHCRSIWTPLLHNLHSRCWPPPPWPPAGPHHPHPTLYPTSSHPWSGGHLPPPIINRCEDPHLHRNFCGHSTLVLSYMHRLGVRTTPIPIVDRPSRHRACPPTLPTQQQHRITHDIN